MFDTIRLSIPLEKVKLNKSDFTANPFKLAPFGMAKWDSNKAMVSEHKLSVIKVSVSKFPHKTGIFSNVFIEFSIPKLIYGENISETEEKDFNIIVKVLQQRLKQMHIKITQRDIKKASVIKLHSGKNIILPRNRGITCKTVISALANIPINTNIDHAKVKFKNGGEEFLFHTTEYELCFYDKKMEYIYSNDDEMSEEYPILRYEYRLNRNEAVKKAFLDCGIQGQKDFQSIFKKDIAKRLNLYAWDKLIKPHLSSCFLANIKKMTLLNSNINKGIGIESMLKLLGLRYIMSIGGLEFLKDQYPSKTTTTIINRLEKDIKKLDLSQTTIYKVFDSIYESISANISIKKSDLS